MADCTHAIEISVNQTFSDIERFAGLEMYAKMTPPPANTFPDSPPMTRDPRWILLAENGEWSTVGRHREPSPEDIARFEGRLAGHGLGGWLAIASNSFHASVFPEMVMERVLGDPKVSFDEAVAILRQKMDVLSGGRGNGES